MKVSTRTLPRPQPKQRDARPPPSPRFSSEAHHTLQPLAVVGDRTLRGPSSASIPQGWSCTGRVEYRRPGARQSKHKHGLGAWSRPKTHQQTISAWFLLHMIFCIHSVLDIYIYIGCLVCWWTSRLRRTKVPSRACCQLSLHTDMVNPLRTRQRCPRHNRSKMHLKPT